MFLGKGYYFDPRTAVLLKVSPPVMSILSFAEDRSLNVLDVIREIPDPLKRKHTLSDLLKAAEEIKAFNEEYGLFNNTRPYFQGVASAFDEAEILESLENKLSHLVLNVTQDCNMNCRYCKYSGVYPAELPIRNNHMSVEVAESALYFLKSRSKESKVLRIGFYGGEPLLKFDLIQYVVSRAYGIFQDKKVQFSLTTNGLLLFQEEIVDFLAKNSFYLKVSLDGYRNAHDRYRVSKKWKGTFDVIYRNLRSLKERHTTYFLKNVGYIVTLAPPYDLRGLKDFFENSEISTSAPIVVNFVDPLGTDFYSEFGSEEPISFDRQMEKILEEEKRLWKEGRFSPFLESLIYRDLVMFHIRSQGFTGEVLYPSGMCIPGFERTFVDVNGDISPCERVHYHVLIGNVKDGFDYQKIKRVVDLLVKKRERCKDCEIAKICSLCFAGTFVHGEFSEENFETLCRSRKKRWQKLLNIYIDILETNQNFFDFVEHVDGADEKG